MEILEKFISLGAPVLMPVILSVVGIAFRLPVGKVFKSGMLVGIGFLGINMVMELLLKSLSPVTKAMISRIGLKLTVTDVGWTTAANIGWNSSIMLEGIIGFAIINIIMLTTGLTKTVDIDIFNFWTLFLLGAIIYAVTKNYWIAVVSMWILFGSALIVGDKTAPKIQTEFNLKGVSFPQIAYLSWIPIGMFTNMVIKRIPKIKAIEISPESLSRKIGVFGEPVGIGFFLGLFLGLLGGYPFGRLLTLTVSISGCMVILPKMIDLLVEGLQILREGVEIRLKQWFPNLQFYIAMDVSMLIGDPSVLSTALLMVPISCLLAFLLPGNRLLPLADLSSLMFPFALTAAYLNRNMFRMILTGLIIVPLALYFGTFVAPAYTLAASMSGVSVPTGIHMMSNFIGSAGTWVGALTVFISKLFT